MAAQYKTRRGADGRLESIPEEEQGALKAAAEGIAPPPAARPGAVTDRDLRFMAANTEQEPPALPPESPPVQPPPPPPRGTPVQPPPLPEEEEESSGIGGAIKGAVTGSKAGPIGAVVGAGVGFMAGRKSNPAPIGTLDRGSVAGQSDDTLRELLEVQKQIALVGSPIKNAVTTNAVKSRM